MARKTRKFSKSKNRSKNRSRSRRGGVSSKKTTTAETDREFMTQYNFEQDQIQAGDKEFRSVYAYFCKRMLSKHPSVYTKEDKKKILADYKKYHFPKYDTLSECVYNKTCKEIKDILEEIKVIEEVIKVKRQGLFSNLFGNISKLQEGLKTLNYRVHDIIEEEIEKCA